VHYKCLADDDDMSRWELCPITVTTQLRLLWYKGSQIGWLIT